MKGIQALREERKAIAAQMTNLVNKPEGEKWTEDDQSKYNEFKNAIGPIDHLAAY
jgi:hypothetical protein